ncbi:hypothetical protein CORT_0D04430 [Candida orthopsilosis Co 90-125]|uniref:Uncharacterized protein n=1 Tax=Candida orthopsilosis (strain 90-125) TaxID=1136231 RepID=H8X635_CANO9|nr:hypothetical protein CORT_0D04430 [Candida orthopsilosis Co 90-125]CCG23283.1 hypothetical protein CORT_0D04430 [Candida orthopsilosis Co 90-125]
MFCYALLLYLVSLSHCNLQDQFPEIQWTDLDATTTITTQPITNNLTTSLLYKTNPQPHIYTISTLEALQSSAHITKLSNTNNLFYIKSTQSSLQYDYQLNYWTLLTTTNTSSGSNFNFDANTDSISNSSSPSPPTQPHSWIPITSCLESIHGSGGYLSRYITIYLETTMDQIGEVTLGIPPVYFSIGTSLAVGKRVGLSKLNTLLFSCSINPGEVAQFYIRPSFIEIPNLKCRWYKLKGKKLHYVGFNVIKSFKMLVVDTPEHQCWVSRNINDLQCGKTFEDKVTIHL